VLQNLVAAATMAIVGDTFWGLRASSILFGLVTFLGLVMLVRHQADEARRFDGVPAWLGRVVVGAACVLLLVDLSSLLSARIVEPTVSRMAVVIVLYILVARGTLLGDGHRLRGTLAFGMVTGAAVFFVYIYNAFLVPAGLVAVAWSAYRTGGVAAAWRHAAVFVVAVAAIAAVYFGLIALVYGQSPIGWYETRIGPLVTTSRGSGFSLAKVASILDANIFRLDPAFLGMTLTALPIFAWTLIRRPSAWLVLVAASIVAFVVQSGFVADYPQRKFVMILLFAVPVVAAGILGWPSFRTWITADQRRLVAVTVWLTGALALTLVTGPLERIPQGGRLASLVLAAAWAGVGALCALLCLRRPIVLAAASVVLALSIVTPLAYADVAFVYLRPAFTFRDANIAISPTIDGQLTAGGFPLYNDSRPAFLGFRLNDPRPEYVAGVLELFRSGQITSLFDYVDPVTRSGWEAGGFRLVETLPIALPEGRRVGRYVYAP
jgi:hypothetical protein